MIRVGRRGASRLTAVLAAAGLVAGGAIAAAGPAAADNQTPASSGTSATLNDLGVFGEVAQFGRDDAKSAGLFTLDTAHSKLRTYCIDYGTYTQKGAKYNEVEWNESKLAKNEHAGQIKWLLENSYPNVPEKKLAETAGVDSLTAEQAATATQLAIWHFSDGKDGKAGKLVGSGKHRHFVEDSTAQKVVEYLKDHAKKVDEPEPALKLDPATMAGKSGERLGPIKVQTTADEVKLTLDDKAKDNKVQVVDKDGKEVSTAKNGDAVYLKAPKSKDALKATLKADADATVQNGRVFTGALDGKPSQTMILAGATKMPQHAEASAAWAPMASTGPIPSVSFKKDCTKGGIDVTATNKGDEDFVFSLEGKQHTVKPGESKTIMVKVAEGQKYSIKISGPGGKHWDTSGVLNCDTGTDKPTTAPSPSSSAPAGGGSAPSTQPSHNAPAPQGGGGGDLAETGASNATPMIAGIAAALVVAGGATVFMLRRKRGQH